MTDRFKITKEGYDKLKSKLDNLIDVERPEVLKSLNDARELGDLSENAEYTYSRERLKVIDGMIGTLTKQLTSADVIYIENLSGEVVDFGATVFMMDEETEKKVYYKLLSEFEADLEQKIISVTSPIGKSLIGKKVGDSVEIKVPNGTKYFRILDIKWEK